MPAWTLHRLRQVEEVAAYEAFTASVQCETGQDAHRHMVRGVTVQSG